MSSVNTSYPKPRLDVCEGNHTLGLAAPPEVARTPVCLEQGWPTRGTQ